ncbi:unnamed protein product, partial [Symbiodinium natans]
KRSGRAQPAMAASSARASQASSASGHMSEGEAADPPPLSRGSVGHPEFCTRPCVYLSGHGSCPRKEECNFCHAPHAVQNRRGRRRFEQQGRQNLDAMSDIQLLIALHVALCRLLSNPRTNNAPMRAIIRCCEQEIAKLNVSGAPASMTPEMLNAFARLQPGPMLSMVTARLSAGPKQKLSGAVAHLYEHLESAVSVAQNP